MPDPVTTHLIALTFLDAITRDDMASAYREGLDAMEDVDWPAVNRAVKERWSMSGLKYIKARAWRDA